VFLAQGRDKRVQTGHPWVFANEIDRTSGDFVPGDIVEVVSSRGHLIGRGYINPASQIRVRFLTRTDEVINEDFFRRRVREAIDYRRRLFGALPDARERAFRLIFAEADYLPALIVDYFAGYLVFQALALGIDRRKEMLMEMVRAEAGPEFPVLGLYERDDVPVRELEGLSQLKGPYNGDVPPRVTIRENDVRLIVDLENGQKTGHFLDQRENRAAIAPYVKGARVLDGFSYTGGFACAAAAYGAREVLGVDVSPQAVALAGENARLNGVEDRVAFQTANVFDFLHDADPSQQRWEVILLDPPAFAKNRAALPGALRGYKEINLRAMKLLPPGGHLITSSCSQHVSEELFREVLAVAAADTKRRLRVVEVRSQGRDHPFLPAAPETRYLKFFVLRVE
jgi:23S rRNA (cytosine1962-C5)-methyltransferase